MNELPSALQNMCCVGYYYRLQGNEDGNHGNQSLNVSSGEEEARSSEQLLELVRFLRREKEITISRFEVAEAETQRLKTQLKQMERQLSEAQVMPLCLCRFSTALKMYR